MTTPAAGTTSPWLAPGIVLAVLAYSGSGGLWINGIGNTADLAARDVMRAETRLMTLESSKSLTDSKLAVVETQLGNMLKVLEKIDAKMERANRKT